MMGKSNQDIATPMNFIREIEIFFKIKFKYDMAANHDNNRVEYYFTEQDNSLEMDWPLDGWCWLNPPFRKLSQFIPKCKEQKDRGCRIVTIWPLSGDFNQIPTWKESFVSIIHGRIWPEVRGVMLCQWDLDTIKGVRGLRWDKKQLTYCWE